MHSKVRLLILLAILQLLLAPAAIAQSTSQAKASASLNAGKAVQKKPDVELSDSELYAKLTSSDWLYPGDKWGNPGSDFNLRSRVTFVGDRCLYPSNQTWLPGRKIEILVRGACTAGTVRVNTMRQTILEQSFSTIEKWKADNTSAQKFPYPSENGITTLKWNFRKNDKRGGFLFLEDGSAVRFAFGNDGSLSLTGHTYLPIAKLDSDRITQANSTMPGVSRETNNTARAQLPKIEGTFFKKLTSKEWLRDSNYKIDGQPTPPKEIAFDKEGHFNIHKDQEGNWIKGPHWSLINRDGMHIIFHPTDSYYKCYHFDNERIKANLSSMSTHPDNNLRIEMSDDDRPDLEPKMLSDHDLSLILHVPTYTKYGDKVYEHRFIANKTK